MKGNESMIIFKRLMLIGLTTVMLFTVMFPGIANHDMPHDVFERQLVMMVDNETEALTLATQHELELISISHHGVALFRASDDQQFQQMLERGFAANGINRVMAPPWMQDDGDPFRDNQYALTMMDTVSAWTLTEGSVDVVIAIIDTGIDIDHEEFVGRISTLSYNVITEQTGLSAVMDDDGHGTMVAGIIGAIKDNNKGIAGMAQNSPLMIIKADSNDDHTFLDSDIIEAILYATENGADVINLSLGGSYANPQVEAAVLQARSAGVVVVAASGNDGDNTPIYPAAFEAVISVGSINENQTLSEFSNYGPTIDVVAPGKGIATTYLNDEEGIARYVTADGTSFAAPQVTGVVALMKSHMPALTDQDIIERLKATTLDLGDPGFDQYFGHGMVHTYDALTLDLATVYFETYGGLAIDPMRVATNRPFHVADAIKGYHDFTGWYLDEVFDTPFLSGETTISEDATLHALFAPYTYTVSFITSGLAIEPITVNHNETFTLPDAEKEGHAFAGWYIDADYGRAYQVLPVTDDLTLYAKFTPYRYTITFESPGMAIDPVQVDHGDIPELIDPIYEGHAFTGWYLDADYLDPYVPVPTTDDLVLHARFEIRPFMVRFLDAADDVIIIQEIDYGQAATPPEGPDKVPSVSLTFIFSGWDKPFDHVTTDLDIRPVYTLILDRSSVSLSPGIDTIETHQDWIDGGIDLHDLLITPHVRSDLDPDTPGLYAVYYDLYVDDILVETYVRMVRVVARKPDIVITVYPDVTTILAGDAYTDAGASTNIGDIETTGHVDASIPGVYVITYRVSHEDHEVIRSKYVHVLARPADPMVARHYLAERKRWT